MSLQDLFRWKGKLEIKDRHGEPVIIGKRPLILHQRVVGDAELTTARKHALKASRSLRKELRSETSVSYATYIPDYDETDDATLQKMVVFAEAVSLRRRALNTAKQPRKVDPLHSEATLEEQEEYEAATEAYDEAVKKAVDDKLIELTKQREKELEKEARPALVSYFISAAVDTACQTEMLRVYNEWCAYLGTYKDKRMLQRAFTDYKTFNNLAPDLKAQVLKGYIVLEIGGEDLKN